MNGWWYGLLIILNAFSALVSSQESATLPPPCAASTYLPGEVSPPFSFALTSGTNLSVPAEPEALPIVFFIVDSASDPGGVILASDGIELDRFLAAAPPASGTFAFLSQSNRDGAAQVESLFAVRLAAIAAEGAAGAQKAAAWRARLAFARDSVEMMHDSALAALSVAWPSPRLWITADGIAPVPRVDGFYECFQWPPAVDNFTLFGPVDACSSDAIIPAFPPQKGLLLVLNVSAVGGECDASAAATWAQHVAPNASGAVIAAPAPALVGRDCADAFVDTPFFPLIVDTQGGAALASRVRSNGAPLPVALNWTCSSATWLSVDSSNRLQRVGWRKYTESSALRWALDELVYLETAAAVARARPQPISLVPAGSQLNAFSANVSFDVSEIRAAGGGAVLDFTLTCGIGAPGDEPCGPWDRILSAAASCWPQGEPRPAAAPFTEIARWITPFRRASGRWQSPADVLIGLVGNASGVGALWTCEISVSSCCEPWFGALNLLLGDGSVASAVSTIPVIFPNMASHFGPDYNSNRSTVLLPPSDIAWTRVSLFAFITGHGSDPPPPVGQGCEYAPTSHAFALGPPSGESPLLIVNSSVSAYAQYMLAGSEEACAQQVGAIDADGRLYGVIANQHGDYRDGRNGWCPGQGVRSLQWDVTPAVTARGVNISYSALSYYVGGSHPSAAGCGGDIVFSAALIFY